MAGAVRMRPAAGPPSQPIAKTRPHAHLGDHRHIVQRRRQRARLAVASLDLPECGMGGLDPLSTIGDALRHNFGLQPLPAEETAPSNPTATAHPAPTMGSRLVIFISTCLSCRLLAALR